MTNLKNKFLMTLLADHRLSILVLMYRCVATLCIIHQLCIEFFFFIFQKMHVDEILDSIWKLVKSVLLILDALQELISNAIII